jgi:hypothetical protein
MTTDIKILHRTLREIIGLRDRIRTHQDASYGRDLSGHNLLEYLDAVLKPVEERRTT